MGLTIFGDAGNGRNPRIGEHVLFGQCPTVRGKVTAQNIGADGETLFRVEWSDGPVPCSWHPAGGLCEDNV